MLQRVISSNLTICSPFIRAGISKKYSGILVLNNVFEVCTVHSNTCNTGSMRGVNEASSFFIF